MDNNLIPNQNDLTRMISGIVSQAHGIPSETSHILKGRMLATFVGDWSLIYETLQSKLTVLNMEHLRQGYDEASHLIGLGENVPKTYYLLEEKGQIKAEFDKLKKENQLLQAEIKEKRHKAELYDEGITYNKVLLDLHQANAKIEYLQADIKRLKAVNTELNERHRADETKIVELTIDVNEFSVSVHGVGGLWERIHKLTAENTKLKKANTYVKDETKPDNYYEELKTQLNHKFAISDFYTDFRDGRFETIFKSDDGLSLYKTIYDTVVEMYNEKEPKHEREAAEKEPTLSDITERGQKLYKALNQYLLSTIHSLGDTKLIFAGTGTYTLLCEIADAIHAAEPPKTNPLDFAIVGVEDMTKALQKLRKANEDLSNSLCGGCDMAQGPDWQTQVTRVTGGPLSDTVIELVITDRNGKRETRKITLPGKIVVDRKDTAQGPEITPENGQEQAEVGPGKRITIPKAPINSTQIWPDLSEITGKPLKAEFVKYPGDGTNTTQEDDEQDLTPFDIRVKFVALLRSMLNQVEHELPIPDSWLQEFDDMYHNFMADEQP